VEAVIEHGMRRVADQEKLASQLGPLADLVREASYMAAQAEASVVSRAHVEQALQARIFRANRLEEKLRELITEGTVPPSDSRRSRWSERLANLGISMG
jgi:predicted ATP-dependent protease